MKNKNISIIDWVCIYAGTIIGVNVLVSTQLYPSQWIASLLPGGVNDVNLMFIYEVLQAALIIGGTLLCLYLRGKTLKDIGWNHPRRFKFYITAVLFGVTTCSLTLVVSSILVQLFPQWSATQNVVSTALQVDSVWGIVVSFLSVGVLAPLCEEVLFRGYLYHAIVNKFGTAISICLTSFVFAMVHGQWFQLLPLFFAGLFLNLFYVRTQSLIATVVMHSAWNSFSLFLVIYMRFVV